MIRLLMLALFAGTMAISANGQTLVRPTHPEPYILPDHLENDANIASYVETFPDTIGQYTFQDVLSGKADALFGENNFRQNPWRRHDYILNMWGRFAIYNPSQETQNLVVKAVALDTLDFYVFYPNGKTQHFVSGNLVETKDATYPGPSITVLSGDTVICYFRNRSDNFYLYLRGQKIRLGETNTVWSSLATNRIYHGIFYGIMVALIFYSIAFYITIRKKIYLYLLLFIIAATLYFLYPNRIGPLYIWTSYPFYYINKYGDNMVFAVLLAWSFSLFSMAFISLKQYFPKLYYVIIGILSVNTLTCVSLRLITGYGELQRQFLNLSILSICILIIVASLILLYRGIMMAKIYLGIFSITFVAVIIHLLTNVSIVPKNAFTVNILQTAIAVTCLLFSISIGYQVRKINLAKRKAEKEASDTAMENERLVLEQNKHLEHKVSERTHELQQSLDNLKTTQEKLIKQEKLASLGQLTAGIAHEIQNPLNFVNNFSEVSNELLDEFISSHDEEERNEIIDNLKINLSKINQHGKRADGIVKGMLQHARSGSGEREPVDINTICEEFISLAFHGIRAQHSGFNCTVEKSLDNSIPKVSVVAQDISRVLLNLLNNALQAVYEKSIKESDGYHPVVTISTWSEDGHVAISVKDNGPGIPDHIREKIFEPFFTTKPTGSGTGLGLSISYDIVKAHGGDIQVKSNAREGSEFVILLPV